MDINRSQLLSNLLGSVSISELPTAPYSDVPTSGQYYLTYKNVAANADVDMEKTKAVDLYNYLLNRVFFLLADNTTTVSTLDGLRKLFYGTVSGDAITGFYDNTKFPEKDSLGFGRFLYQQRKAYLRSTSASNGDPIGVSEPTLSDYFMKSFQYFYLENPLKAARTVLLHYKESDTGPDLSKDMWDTNLSASIPAVDLSDAAKWKNSSKCLFIPNTSTTTEDGKLRFRRRNYAKIVDGNIKWIPTPSDSDPKEFDRIWACRKDSESQWLEDNEPGKLLIQPDKIIDRTTLGDIDQTIKSIKDYLDDWNDNLGSSLQPYKGMVVITTSSEEKKSDSAWNDELFKDRFIYCNNAVSATGGSNTETVPNLPKHLHGGTIATQNISIIGRPEGEDLGGVAILNTVERSSSSANTGRSSDAKQEIVANPSYNSVITKGPYSGKVKYSDTNINNQAQHPHNNMPLYYRVRVLVKTN